MDAKYASGARQQSATPLQALAGVRAVASLLGHSRKKKTAVFSCTKAGDQLRSPPCITESADHTQSNMPEPGMGGDKRKKDPRPGMARDKHQKTHLPGMASTEQRRQGRQDQMRCTHTEHTNPPSSSGGTCTGVPAGPQPHRGAVFSCQYTGRPIGPRHEKCGQTPRTGTSGTGQENAPCARDKRTG